MPQLKKAVTEYQELHQISITERAVFENVAEGVFADMGSAAKVDY
jgi:hypothetical protein